MAAKDIPSHNSFRRHQRSVLRRSAHGTKVGNRTPGTWAVRNILKKNEMKHAKKKILCSPHNFSLSSFWLPETQNLCQGTYHRVTIGWEI